MIRIVLQPDGDGRFAIPDKAMWLSWTGEGTVLPGGITRSRSELLRVRAWAEGGGARSFRAQLVELAVHPFESGLGEVRQRRIAMLVAFQHPKSHQAKQHGTRHFIFRA